MKKIVLGLMILGFLSPAGASFKSTASGDSCSHSKTGDRSVKKGYNNLLALLQGKNKPKNKKKKQRGQSSGSR